ncbi:uncharacterized protein BDZ99DRAFT_519959 [Mytilinidion resinicola]|uniref:Uncharacterized protein n=1 Tax=Mytilinidion resinicola TaxID=574789 RepID=A0A6A6YM55_9PEZI|nr:uncharacterized protein BDZ99DRAFT_519959 [Mytilinidion resinicola]KAF2809861.1 hypothetical protein BDZ99DRAFT_519959 [Mytilinidion resinicola]
MPNRSNRVLYRQRVDDASSMAPSNTTSTVPPPPVQREQPNLKELKAQPTTRKHSYGRLCKDTTFGKLSGPSESRPNPKTAQLAPANAIPRLNPLAATFRPETPAKEPKPLPPHRWVDLDGVQKQVNAQDDLYLIETNLIRIFASNKGLGKLAEFQERFAGEQFDKGAWNEQVLERLEMSFSRDKETAEKGETGETRGVKTEGQNLAETEEELKELA